MADGRLERDDIASKEAFKAPFELREGFEALEKQVDDVLKVSRKYNQEIGNTNSTTKLKKQVKELTDEQKKMKDVHQQLIDKMKKQEAELAKLNKQQAKSKKVVQDNTKAMEGFDNATGGMIGRAKELGRTLSALAKNPFVLIAAVLIGTIVALTSAARSFYAATGEGEDTIGKRVAGWNGQLDVLRNKWAEVGKAVDEFFFGKDNEDPWWQKVIDGFIFKVLPQLFIEMKLAKIRAEEQFMIADELGDKLIDNILARAKAEREVDELLLKAKDKLAYTDQQRIDFLKRALTVGETQMKNEVSLAAEELDVLERQLAIRHNISVEQLRALSREEEMALLSEDELHERTKLYEARAKLVKLEGDYYKEQKRVVSELSALQLEVETTRVKNERAYVDALKEGNVGELQRRIELNKEILAEGKLNFIERTKLLTEQYDLEEALLQSQKEKELDIIKRAAEDKIRAEGIFDPAQIQERLAQDKVYQQLRTNIYEKYNFQQLQNFKKFSDELDEEERTRAAVSFKATQSHLDKEIKQIEETNRKKLAYKEKLNAALLELEHQLFSSTTQVIGNSFDAQLQRYDQQLEELTRLKEQELAAVGDNEEAKAKIINDYAAQEQQVRDQQAQTQRRKAIFDKAQAAFQVGINTAQAIAKVVADSPLTFGLPWSAIIAGIGAAQLAAILTRPIPSYAVGTDDHPGGLAVVGERGSELINVPGVGAMLSPGRDTMMYLPKGSEVYPHDETLRMLALAGLSGSDRRADKRFNLAKALNGLERTIRTKREVHINFTRRGAEAIIANANSKNKILGKFYA